MTGWTRLWRQWPRALRTRYALAAARPVGAGMTLLNPRRPLVHIRPQIAIQASWNLAGGSHHIYAAQPLNTRIEMPVMREVVRERVSSSHTSVLVRPNQEAAPEPAREVV